MANASAIPGDMQRENTEDVLQGERLSEADNCPPIPPQHAQGADVWEEMERTRERNRNHVQPQIRKVLKMTNWMGKEKRCISSNQNHTHTSRMKCTHRCFHG